MNNDDYIIIQGWMISELGLSGKKLLIYALIHGFSKDGKHEFSGSLDYIAKWIGSKRQNVCSLLRELVIGGFLSKREEDINGVKQNYYSVLKIITGCSKNHNGGVLKIRTDNIIDNIIEENKENTKRKKENDIFEQCWITYRRKGSKKKAKEYWGKLSADEIQIVLPHIKAYVQTRDVNYQKDFERYLRDKIFNDVVYNGNNIVYDPSKGTGNNYVPQGNDVYYSGDEYFYIGSYYGTIYDGYTDDDRPDGAEMPLNNGRGTLIWDAEHKQWVKME